MLCFNRQSCSENSLQNLPAVSTILRYLAAMIIIINIIIAIFITRFIIIPIINIIKSLAIITYIVLLIKTAIIVIKNHQKVNHRHHEIPPFIIINNLPIILLKRYPIASINRSVNQPISQPISKSINQSMNQSINQSMNQSINQSISQAISQSINRSEGV